MANSLMAAAPRRQPSRAGRARVASGGVGWYAVSAGIGQGHAGVVFGAVAPIARYAQGAVALL